MSEDKQIEEMCAIMADASYAACEDTPLVPESAGICDKVDCHRCKQARRLMSAGYAKASEVAEEIFAEIEEILIDNLYQIPEELYDFYDKRGVQKGLAELKKKYIGKDTNVTTNTEEEG